MNNTSASIRSRSSVLPVAVPDPTDPKRTEDTLQQGDEPWKTIFEHSPTMLFMLDAAGTILAVSPFAAERLGYAVGEMIGGSVQNIVHAADKEAARRNAAGCLEQLGLVMRWELRKVRKDGQVIWVRETARATLISKQPVILINCEDITQTKSATDALREMQGQLTHANRIAVLGQLTAAIAHEVTQPIAATVTNAQVALRFLDGQPPDLEEVRDALADIVKDSDRANDLIGRIRDLIKKPPPRKHRLDINEAIRQVIVLTRSEAAANGISLQTELAEDLPLIRGDRIELQQVILNLVINAIQAMGGVAEDARELLLSTQHIQSEGVQVAVRDSGPGLTADNLGRLFEPFYTTKPDGMGMGLSICQSIIEAHGGRLAASANVPRGAVFQFVLPAS